MRSQGACLEHDEGSGGLQKLIGKFIAHDSRLPVWEFDHTRLAKLNAAGAGFGAFRVKADLNQRAIPVDSVENDPEQTFDLIDFKSRGK
jgi:hypothetical protein